VLGLDGRDPRVAERAVVMVPAGSVRSPLVPAQVAAGKPSVLAHQSPVRVRHVSIIPHVPRKGAVLCVPPGADAQGSHRSAAAGDLRFPGHPHKAADHIPAPVRINGALRASHAIGFADH
jgi:hypothetical protein